MSEYLKLSDKLHCHKGSTSSLYVFFCPGCRHDHCFTVRSNEVRPAWKFNGDFLNPTFTPSLRCGNYCHLMLTDGIITFLDDCDHALAGKRVQMELMGD